MRNNPKLGSPEAKRLIAYLDDFIEQPTVSKRRTSYQSDYSFEEATDEEYGRIADAYERRIYGD